MKSSKAAQFYDQFLRQPFREVSLVVVPALDSKRHDRHGRRSLRQVARQAGRGGLKAVSADFSANLIDSDRLGQDSSSGARRGRRT